MRIRSWTSADGGCGYYRLSMIFGELSRHGHTTRIPPEPRLILPADEALDTDVLVCQRLAAQPAFAEFQHRAALVRAGGGGVVYELDDDIWSIDVANPALAAYLHPQVGDYAERFVAECDLVTCSTEPLAERLRQWNPNVVVLPNRIDAAVLDLPTLDRPSGKIVVGWTASTSHTTDLRSVMRPWRDFFLGRPDVELHIMGADYRPMLELPGVRHTGWHKDLMAYYGAIDFDVGLAPLTPIEFNRHKSGNKAIEYAARGIPCVATDMEPYRDVVIDGVTGWLVRSPDEWGRRIGELADDEAMRVEMGANARKMAEGWTIQEHWPAWEAAYRSALCS